MRRVTSDSGLLGDAVNPLALLCIPYGIVMTMAERIQVIAACRFVDEVIPTRRSS
jgi:hypothetical protein